jgi:hypothetical protein
VLTRGPGGNKKFMEHGDKSTHCFRGTLDGVSAFYLLRNDAAILVRKQIHSKEA